MHPLRRPLSGRLKYAAKWLLAHGLYRAGLLRLWIRLTLHDRAVVLAYHRVLDRRAQDDTWSHPAIIVTPETFERHLQALKQQFRVVSVAEFEDAVCGRGFAGPTCLITFDDGWWDTYAAAWPALLRANVPAVVFLPVRYIDSQDTFWQERLGHLLQCLVESARGDQALDAQTRSLLAEIGLSDLVDVAPMELPARLVDRLRGLKAVAALDPRAVLTRVEALLGTPPAVPQVDRFMTWAQVKDMALGGIAFGGHGATHQILSRLPLDEVRHEATESLARLSEELAAPAQVMSYPNGGSNARVEHEVAAAGYRLAFTMDRGFVDSRTRATSIPRVNVHEGIAGDIPMFLARIAGIL